MTAPEAAQIILDRAVGSEHAARTSGVDELRMSKVRDYVLRYPDREAMTAFQSGRDAVALHATFKVVCAHIEAAPKLLGDDPTPIDNFEEEPTDPTPLDPRGAKR